MQQWSPSVEIGFDAVDSPLSLGYEEIISGVAVYRRTYNGHSPRVIGVSPQNAQRVRDLFRTYRGLAALFGFLEFDQRFGDRVYIYAESLECARELT